MRATVFRSAKRVFDCRLADTKLMVTATAKAALLKGAHIVVGDEVELRLDDVTGQYEIYELHPRSNEVFRKIVRENKKKPIASNLDFLAIVSSVSNPVYKAGLIDRYIVRSNQWEIPLIVIFNKMDQFENQFDLEYERAKYDSLGIQNFCLSALDEDKYDFSKLFNMMKNKRVMFLGQSGVGKSKLISALSKGKADLKSGRLSLGVKKGAHTTSWSEIIDCEYFLLVDSPGVRSMSINDIALEEIDDFFPDLHTHFSSCRFPNCQHDEKSKNCSFAELDPSTLEGRIVIERLEAYKRIRDEIAEIPDWQRKN